MLNVMEKVNRSTVVSKTEIIGFSESQMPLTITYFGDEKVASSLKIFIMAGQHGDEPYGRHAISLFMDSIEKSSTFDHTDLNIAILDDANPDGSHVNTRTNAAGVDLNRDHQLLKSKENYFIHSFVRKWEPNIIVDVHNYPPRRKHLLKRNLVYSYDIFVDVATNPSILQTVSKERIANFFDWIKSDLKQHGYSCERYTIVKPSGRVRHSTVDITDARNSMALTCNAFTILLEGRNPTQEDDESKERTISSQYHSLMSILKWVQKNKDELQKKEDILQEVDVVPVRFKYRVDHKPIILKFENSLTKKIESISFSNFVSDLEIQKSVQLPYAYAIPLDKTRLIEILKKHGFQFQSSNPSKLEHVEQYFIDKLLQPVKNGEGSGKFHLTIKKEEMFLHDYLLFLINQTGGRALAVFLEPQSIYGLHRYDDLQVPLTPNSRYSILRVLV